MTLANTLIHFVQGGAEQHIDAGGSVANKGTITNSSAGQFVETVVKASTPQTITNYGFTAVGSSSGTGSYALPAATPGVRKLIMASTGIATNATIVTTTAAGATMGSSWTKVTFSKAGCSVELIGLTAAQWGIVGASTSAVFAVA